MCILRPERPGLQKLHCLVPGIEYLEQVQYLGQPKLLTARGAANKMWLSELVRARGFPDLRVSAARDLHDPGLCQGRFGRVNEGTGGRWELRSSDIELCTIKFSGMHTPDFRARSPCPSVQKTLPSQIPTHALV